MKTMMMTMMKLMLTMTIMMIDDATADDDDGVYSDFYDTGATATADGDVDDDKYHGDYAN